MQQFLFFVHSLQNSFFCAIKVIENEVNLSQKIAQRMKKLQVQLSQKVLIHKKIFLRISETRRETMFNFKESSEREEKSL